MRLLLALSRRRRGRSLLARVPVADELAQTLASLGRYDEPERARALGFDADAVIARGRALRRAEGRP